MTQEGSGGGEACDAWLLKNIPFRPKYIISLEAETVLHRERVISNYFPTIFACVQCSFRLSCEIFGSQEAISSPTSRMSRQKSLQN